MRDKLPYSIHTFLVPYLFLLILLLLSSSMHYAPSPASPQAQKTGKSSIQQKKRKSFQKKKSIKRAKRFSLKGFFRALGTFLGVLGLLVALLSPLLLYLLFPQIATWALFLAGMVSSALLSFFFFVLVFGSYKMFWFWLSLSFAIIFLACFVGLLITLPLFASLSVIGILLLAVIIGLFV